MSQAELDYWERTFSLTAQETNDALMVHKIDGSDWCSISIETNGKQNGEITIRSRLMAEQLHFMLGKLLRD